MDHSIQWHCPPKHLGKPLPLAKKTGFEGKLVQKHLIQSGLSRDVSPFDGQYQLPMVRRNE